MLRMICLLALLSGTVTFANAEGDDQTYILSLAAAQDPQAVNALKQHKSKYPINFPVFSNLVLRVVNQGGDQCSAETASYLLKNGATINPALLSDVIGMILCPGVIESAFENGNAEDRLYILTQGPAAAVIRYSAARAYLQMGSSLSTEEYLQRSSRGLKQISRVGQVFSFLAKQAKDACPKRPVLCAEAKKFDAAFASLRQYQDEKKAEASNNPYFKNKPKQLQTLLRMSDLIWQEFSKPYPQ